MAEPGFWDNQEKAQATIAELKALDALLKPLDEAIGAAADLDTLFEMADEDASLVGEVTAEVDAARGARRSAGAQGPAERTRSTPKARS